MDLLSPTYAEQKLWRLLHHRQPDKCLPYSAVFRLVSSILILCAPICVCRTCTAWTGISTLEAPASDCIHRHQLDKILFPFSLINFTHHQSGVEAFTPLKHCHCMHFHLYRIHYTETTIWKAQTHEAGAGAVTLKWQVLGWAIVQIVVKRKQLLVGSNLGPSRNENRSKVWGT